MRWTKPSPELRSKIAEFFSDISLEEISGNFSPHPFSLASAEWLSHYQGKDEYWFLLLNDDIVAYGMLRGWDEGYAVPSLGICVHPAFQGRGFGKLMMDQLIAIARMRGAEKIILKVKKENQVAQGLYAHYGFVWKNESGEFMHGERRLSLPKDKELTILIATINEAENLKFLLPDLKRCFWELGDRLEILVVDGNSTDGTIKVAHELGARTQHQVLPGYAQAIVQGIRAARGKYLIVMDGDLSHTAQDAHQLYKSREKSDIVINSRYVAGGDSGTGFFRDLLSRTLNAMYRWVLRLPFREISGGFRIYRSEMFDRFDLGAKFYEVQEELLLIPYWLGYQASEIPYTYRPRKAGYSKAKILTYGWHLVAALWRFKKLKHEILASAASTRKATATH